MPLHEHQLRTALNVADKTLDWMFWLPVVVLALNQILDFVGFRPTFDVTEGTSNTIWRPLVLVHLNLLPANEQTIALTQLRPFAALITLYPLAFLSLATLAAALRRKILGANPQSGQSNRDRRRRLLFLLAAISSTLLVHLLFLHALLVNCDAACAHSVEIATSTLYTEVAVLRWIYGMYGVYGVYGR
jgi:hypothetical protein